MVFRHVRCPVTREERVAEASALAWKCFCRLAGRGKDVLGFPMAFAAVVARMVRCGRRLCGQERANDVMSPVAQRRHGFVVQPLPLSTRTSLDDLYASPHGQERQDAYEERLHDNTRTPPPEQAAFRIDFRQWLQTLSARERRILRAMSLNERTKDLSKQFSVSPARISQMRRSFRDGWGRLVGDMPAPTAKA
jgi:predicted aminopeptidase